VDNGDADHEESGERLSRDGKSDPLRSKIKAVKMRGGGS
jgi:hypothetical protein